MAKRVAPAIRDLLDRRDKGIRNLPLYQIIGQGQLELGFPRKAKPRRKRPVVFIAGLPEKHQRGRLTSGIRKLRFNLRNPARNEQVAGGSKGPLEGSLGVILANLELAGSGLAWISFPLG